MDHFQALQIAESQRRRRAVRSATRRHRHLTVQPLAFMAWQLGAEPFTAAAVAWGFSADDRRVVVAGEPRNRDLAFAALTEVARSFNPWFEAERGEADAPQLVLANAASLEMIRRLGRRLAYLPTTGDNAAPEELVTFGRHLRFLGERSRFPGQQLVVVLTDLMNAHWTSFLSGFEAQNLAALDAVTEPPNGGDGHAAAFAAEHSDIGPTPSGEDDSALAPYLEAFNEARDDGASPRRLRKLLSPIARHYTELFDRGWPLVWRCVQRERALEPAPSALARWGEGYHSDCAAYRSHLDWMRSGGRQAGTRDHYKRAARTLHNWEQAHRQLVAEEALDDPLRLIPALLSHDAIVGVVVDVNTDHYRQGPKRRVRRPLVTLELDDACEAPYGKELYWTEDPKREYVLERVGPSVVGGPQRITLELQTNRFKQLPLVGQRAVFGPFQLGGGRPLMLPDDAPWTHQERPGDRVQGSIEEAPR